MIRPGSGRHALLLGATLALGVVGCSVTIVANVDEGGANQLVAELDSRGIASEKSRDPSSADHFRVEVSEDDAPAAVQAIRESDAPAIRAPRLLDALGTNALVPSREAEHARLIAGTAGALERTLEAAPGVSFASVHLAEPFVDPLDGDAPSPAKTASVFIRHRGGSAPIARAEVERLVASAVPGLAPANVNVVELAESAAAPRDIVHLGPLSTTRASVRTVKWIGAAIALSNVLLVGWMAFLWARLRRFRQAPPHDGEPR